MDKHAFLRFISKGGVLVGLPKYQFLYFTLMGVEKVTTDFFYVKT